MSNRSEADKNFLVGLIKQIKFFKDMPHLTEENITELAQNMQFESCNTMDDVVKYGQEGNKFYIILKGVVSVLIPNPDVGNYIDTSGGMSYVMIKRDYNNLLRWKKEVFDPKMDVAKKKTYELYQESEKMR